MKLGRWTSTKATRKSLVIPIYGAALVFLVGCASDDISDTTYLRVQLLKAVNGIRLQGCKCGDELMPPVEPLQWEETLELAAENHVRDMYSNNYFSHISLTGTSPIQRAQQAGYDGAYVGENIARGYTTVQDVINAWLESESHCRALMEPLYKDVGGSRLADYWVLDLGRSD